MPARIVCIGTDQVHVAVRPDLEPGELPAVAHRIDQLLEAGYETVDIVSTLTPTVPPESMSSTWTSFTSSGA